LLVANPNPDKKNTECVFGYECIYRYCLVTTGNNIKTSVPNSGPRKKSLIRIQIKIIWIHKTVKNPACTCRLWQAATNFFDHFRTGLERLEEESRTRVENYEEQLRVMSDLLADMNSRLAAQADTIHQLR
jgi:Predicted coiled-coil domain-containing protein